MKTYMCNINLHYWSDIMADQIVLWSDKSMKWSENVWCLTVISHSACTCTGTVRVYMYIWCFGVRAFLSATHTTQDQIYNVANGWGGVAVYGHVHVHVQSGGMYMFRVEVCTCSEWRHVLTVHVQVVTCLWWGWAASSRSVPRPHTAAWPPRSAPYAPCGTSGGSLKFPSHIRQTH